MKTQTLNTCKPINYDSQNQQNRGIVSQFHFSYLVDNQLIINYTATCVQRKAHSNAMSTLYALIETKINKSILSTYFVTVPK